MPQVSITNSSGTDHTTAVAQISGPIGNSITVVNAGLGYASGAVNIVIGPPEIPDATTGLSNTATATATVSSDTGAITGISITNKGSGYTSAPAITVIGDNIESATVTATLNASVDSIVLINKGSGYSGVTPSISFSGGGGSGAVATPTKTVPTTTPVSYTHLTLPTILLL